MGPTPTILPKAKGEDRWPVSEQPSRAWAWRVVIEEVTKSLPLLRVSLPPTLGGLEDSEVPLLGSSD